jgi:hypothetical protein
MPTLSVKDAVELIAAGMLPLAYVGFMWHRIAGKKSIGARAIQFMAVVTLLPVIVILALEKVLDGQTIGTLIGGLTGYLLSGISNYDRPGGPDA